MLATVRHCSQSDLLSTNDSYDHDVLLPRQ